jgi:hypothetical protein
VTFDWGYALMADREPVAKAQIFLYEIAPNSIACRMSVTLRDAEEAGHQQQYRSGDYANR